MFAKTYSRKQMGVVYRAVKEGRLEVGKAQIAWLYDRAGGMEVDCSSDLETAEKLYHGMRNAVRAIFEGDYEDAQRSIDAMVA